MNMVYIRAWIAGENAAGQKCIKLLANGADGIEFWTNDESIVTTEAVKYERPRGKWEPLGFRSGPFKHPLSEDYKCTNCGYEYYRLIDMLPITCPNCGADMREVNK